MKITIAQFHQNREVNQQVFANCEAARAAIEEGNRESATGWRWGLSDTTFFREDGTEVPINEANKIRVACGQPAW